jgi:hypothetical protein
MFLKTGGISANLDFKSSGTEKKIVAETHKLDGNSSYGKTVTNKERHTDVIYCKKHQVSRYFVDPSFRRSLLPSCQRTKPYKHYPCP